MEQKNLYTAAREASRVLAAMSPERIDAVLLRIADAIDGHTDEILEANAAECAALEKNDSRYDRLLLTPERLSGIAEGIREVAALPSPLGKVLEAWTRPNGMEIRKVSVPFGVIGSIFESRPNVIPDVFALCFKAGSACIIKSGPEAEATSEAIVSVIRDTLTQENIPAELITILEPTHEAAVEMVRARGMIDLLIPRGKRHLIDWVRDNALVPFIETGAGVCHTYFHSSGDIATGRDIIFNAKTRRVGVCNALDCFLIDRSRLKDLPAICYRLSDKSVEIYADEESFAALEGAYPAELLKHATPDDYGREWLSYRMTLHTVSGIDEALEFIERYGTRHSECIVAENREAASLFLAAVDAACVYANVSTAFTDGGQFGFGAEVGISTQKLHARGPMALREITTYKYLISGAGQTRP